MSGISTTTEHAYRITNPSTGVSDNLNVQWADLDATNHLVVRYIVGNARPVFSFCHPPHEH